MVELPGLKGMAVGFKTTAEALYLRELVLSRMEAASAELDPTRRQAGVTFVVVGAGYAGVELIAQMARMTRNLLPTFPALSQADIRWLLLDASGFRHARTWRRSWREGTSRSCGAETYRCASE